MKHLGADPVHLTKPLLQEIIPAPEHSFLSDICSPQSTSGGQILSQRRSQATVEIRLWHRSGNPEPHTGQFGKPLLRLQGCGFATLRYGQAYFPQVFDPQTQIDAGALWISMSQHLPNGPDGHAATQQMNRQGMTQRVAADRRNIQPAVADSLLQYMIHRHTGERPRWCFVPQEQLAE